MIRLASDPLSPNPGRTGWQPGTTVPSVAEGQPVAERGERQGHAWPFLSRPSTRPQVRIGARPPRADSPT